MKLHNPPIPSDWSSEDWDRDKVKAREQESLINFMLIRTENDAPVTDKTLDRQETKIANHLQKLTSNQDEESPDVPNTLVSLPEVPEGTPEMNGAKVNKGKLMHSYE